MSLLIKLATNHPWVKEFKIVQVKGQALLKVEIITEMGRGHVEIFFSSSTGPEKKASSHSADSNLFKSWFPGVGWGYIRKNRIYVFYTEENLQNQQAKCNQT
jgi:hypothetical protein